MKNQHRSKFTANSDNIKADYSTFPKIGEICRFSPENNRLQAGGNRDNLASTTTNNGHRTRQTCGFFVSQICQNHGMTTPVIHSEFAIRLISRNKAETIRTNKACRSFAVVETVSPLSSDIPIQSLTKQKTMTYKFLTHGDTAKEPLYTAIPNTEQKDTLLNISSGGMLSPVMAKSITSREKLNNLSKANSTPNRAFFVRNFRTPKENSRSKNGFAGFLSMVERKGKGLPFAVFLLKRFLTPLRSTAHREKSDGRFSQNLLSKAFTMTYKFLTQFNNRQLTITITANSYAEALSRIQWHNRPICITRNLKTKGGVYA